jgi:hypothetical protein
LILKEFIKPFCESAIIRLALFLEIKVRWDQVMYADSKKKKKKKKKNGGANKSVKK